MLTLWKGKDVEGGDSDDGEADIGSRAESVAMKKPWTEQLTVCDTVHEVHTAQNALTKKHSE